MCFENFTCNVVTFSNDRDQFYCQCDHNWIAQWKLVTCGKKGGLHHLSLAYALYLSSKIFEFLSSSFSEENLWVFNDAIFTARLYASAVLAVIVCLSVCPSVCLSVTSRSCTKMAKPRIRLTTPYDSPETLVFRCQKSRRNSNDIAPNGAPNIGAVGSNGRFAANISLYLRNGAR